MYKARLQQWDIEKKINAVDAVEIFHQQTARTDASNPSVLYRGGRKINPEPIVLFIHRTAVDYFLERNLVKEHGATSLLPEAGGPSGNEIVRVPQQLEDSTDAMLLQECMQILGNYVAGFLEARQQEGTSSAVLSSIFTWDHYLAIAQAFIARDRVREGSLLLKLCFSKYKAYIQQPDWFFWPVTYKVAVQLAYIDGRLADMFLRYASALTSILLPPTHPLSQLWSRIRIFGMQGLYRFGEVLLDSYLHTWERYAAMARLDTTAIVQIALLFIQLHCSGRITYVFLRNTLTTIIRM